MKKVLNWQVLLGAGLLALSGLIYLLHYAIFRDAHHIFIYLIGDVAFVPVEVLLVTLIIHKLLSVREKRAMLKKLNMVIGAFYSEVGTELLGSFSSVDKDIGGLRETVVIEPNWKQKDFMACKEALGSHGFAIAPTAAYLMGLKEYLMQRRGFLLRLLENPNLLEHEAFTDLLWAVFHLTDELAHREDLESAPETDINHLAGDVKRAYSHLLAGWLDYMSHLKADYPYLFALALRTNPFNPGASAVVT